MKLHTLHNKNRSQVSVGHDSRVKDKRQVVFLRVKRAKNNLGNIPH